MDVDARTLLEGQITTGRVAVSAPAGDDNPAGVGDVVTAVLSFDPWIVPDPPAGARAVWSAGDAAEVEIPLRAIRWGRHEVALTKVACTSRLGAYRSILAREALVVITALPLEADFDAVDAMPRPAGLVGLHRSHRQGSGAEPAEVRPFRPGDRLRRINWAVSSRTGELHVTATWSDRDTQVTLLLDTEHDIGTSEGVDGRASSLDTAVRAAGAIAEHYLRAGDRVGLIDLGRRVRDVPAGGGRHHLRRLLDVLVAAEPGPEPPCRRRADPAAHRRCARRRADPVRRTGRPGPGRPPRAARTHRDRDRHAARGEPLPPTRRGTRWRRGCGRSNAPPRSTASVSSACRWCAGAAAARWTRCSATSAGWRWRRGPDDTGRGGCHGGRHLASGSDWCQWSCGRSSPSR